MPKIILNDDQKHALSVFNDFLADDNEKYMIIQGSAGCGKSTLIPFMHDHLQAQYQMYKLLLQTKPDKGDFEILLTATTNKAAAIIQEITGMETTTIHSLLNVTVTYNMETGKPKLSKKKSYALIYNKIIVIDEASMINDDLFRLIDDTTMNSKVILMGDQYQLAPVKQTKSIMETLPCTKVTMNKIMRNSGIIMHTGAQYRNTVETGIFEDMPNDPLVKQVNKKDYLSLIKKAFTDQDYSLNKAKVLAWQNDRVHAYNSHIRQLRGFPKTLVEGETVFTNNPILVNTFRRPVDSPIYISKIGRDTISSGVKGKMVELDHVISLFLPDNPYDAKALLKNLAKKKDWATHYAIKETWLDLRPAYASTVHKSQGSSYDTVFIDLSDIGRCHIWSDVARMLYVAISRAVKQVYLYGQLPPRYCKQV